jgi:hypothetical protein
MRYKEFIKENIAPIPPLATNKNTVNQIPQANTSGPDNLSQAISQVENPAAKEIKPGLAQQATAALGTAKNRFAAGFAIGKGGGGAGTGSVEPGAGLKADYAAQGPERTAFDIYKNMQTGVFPTGIEAVAGTPDYNKIQSILRSPPGFWKQHVDVGTSPYESKPENAATQQAVNAIKRAAGGQKIQPTNNQELNKLLKAAGAI